MRDGSRAGAAGSTPVPTFQQRFRTRTGQKARADDEGTGEEDHEEGSREEGTRHEARTDERIGRTAALLEELGGPAPLIAFASTLGFDTRAFPFELGVALGQAEVTPLEMAQLAGVVANDQARGHDP